MPTREEGRQCAGVESPYSAPSPYATPMPGANDPMGRDTFQCCHCGDNFDVDWAEGTVTPWLQLEMTVDVEDSE